MWEVWLNGRFHDAAHSLTQAEIIARILREQGERSGTPAETAVKYVPRPAGWPWL